MRYLERYAGQHRNRVIPKKPTKSFSLPSLCEESESNAKDFETDSDEADKNEIESGERERIQALTKPAGVEEDNLASSMYTFASFDPDAYDQSMLLNRVREESLSYSTANDISFPCWNIPVCSSPPVPSFL